MWTLTLAAVARASDLSSSASNKMAEILLGGKRLSELKVTELKEELDSRGLSKKGVKTVLITRLKNAILKEELEVLVVSSWFC